MKIVAMMMVGAGELDRYLTITVPALLEFCDDVVVRWEGQAEHDYLDGLDVALFAGSGFFDHEGRARQELLDAALLFDPTHLLAIDADELVTDGYALRRACEASQCPVLSLEMEEIWITRPQELLVRQDGGWRTHPVPVCFRAPTHVDQEWRIQDKALACGREPLAVRGLVRQGCSEPSGTELLHLGWANHGERQARYDRYVKHDGGRFHASAHLQSIMWPDARVAFRQRMWPTAWPEARISQVVERANRA